MNFKSSTPSRRLFMKGNSATYSKKIKNYKILQKLDKTAAVNQCFSPKTITRKKVTLNEF